MPTEFHLQIQNVSQVPIAKRTDRFSIGLNNVRIKYRRPPGPGDRAQALQGLHSGNLEPPKPQRGAAQAVASL